MKKILLPIFCVVLLSLTTAKAQETKTQLLETFSKVNLEGNIEIHLDKGATRKVKIETKKLISFDDLEMEVRNNELFIAYKRDEDQTPKFIVYLEHTGINEVEMSGLVSLFSESVLDGSNLTLKGSGIIKGEIEVTVEKLEMDTDGITNMTISGTTDIAVININGLGKINAKGLEARSIKQHSDGFAKVKIGS